jgi:hypothetical protein
MSIPIIDLSDPDISELARQVKDACVVRLVMRSTLNLELGVYVSQKPWSEKNHHRSSL